MPIEKVNLGLQVVTTVATIWLGYVGYELTKAQNQIAEVQTYGLPPTVNKQGIISTKADGNQVIYEGPLRVQITNNHKYPITARRLLVTTAIESNLVGCIPVQPKSRTLFECHINEVIKAGDVKFVEIALKTEPFFSSVSSAINDPTSIGLIYYDPILNSHTETGPLFDGPIQLEPEPRT